MKRISSIIPAVATVAFLFQSCATLKPLAKSVSEPDYNKRITVTEPQYKKVPNAIGYVVDLAFPVAGAVAGMYLPAIVSYDESTGGTVPMEAGNIALGALAGLGVANVANGIAGYGAIVNAGNHAQWVRKACGSDYIVLSDKDNVIKLISKAAESSFSVKNQEDVEDFLAAFPGSAYSASVFDQAMAVIPRTSYPWLIDRFPGQDFTMKAKTEYVKGARGFSELDDALKLYGAETGLNASPTKENLYFAFVKDYSGAINFNQRFPRTELSRKALGVALASNPSASQIESLQYAYGDAFNLTAKDFEEMGGDAARNYYQAMYTKEKVSTEGDFHKFVEKYAWIDFPGKKDQVLEKAWDFAYDRVTDGKDAFYAVRDIYKRSYAKKLGLDKNYVYDWAIDKTARTIHDGISILNHYAQSSLSPDFARWFDAEHTAGQVESKGEIKFVVYGEVKNSSKFDVPLDLEMAVDVNNVHDVNLNAGGGLLGTLISAGAAAMGHKEELYKRVENIVYSFPQLNAGQTDYFAFVIDLGEGMMASGLNLGDRLKVASHLAIGTVNYNPKVRSGRPSEEQIARQYEAMSIASHGLPKGKVIDLDNLSWLWGEGYSTLDQGYYNAEGARIKAREEAEQAAKEEAENYNHCRVHLRFKDGQVLSNESFVAGDDSGLFFNESYTFKTDSDGYAEMRWPKANGPIVSIGVSMKLFEHFDYVVKDLHIVDGGFYEIILDQ